MRREGRGDSTYGLHLNLSTWRISNWHNAEVGKSKAVGIYVLGVLLRPFKNNSVRLPRHQVALN